MTIRRREEFRGVEAVYKGNTSVRRMGQKWSGSIEMPFFTEAGSTKGMTGTLLKHFFGNATSAENGSSGQYYHMLYPVSNPFSTSVISALRL